MSEEVKSKDYHKGYLTALESCMMLFNAHKFNVDGFEVELSEAIEYERRYIQHLPSFKVDGKETPQEELSKTPIAHQSVDPSKGYEVYGAFADGHPSMVGGPLLPKLAPGTDGSRSNKPVGHAGTGGCKPDDVSNESLLGNTATALIGVFKAISEKFAKKGFYTPSEHRIISDLLSGSITASEAQEKTNEGLDSIHPGQTIVMEPGEKPSEALNQAAGNESIEAVCKAFEVPSQLPIKPTDITADDTNITTHNFEVTPDLYCPFRTRTLDYILTPGNFSDYHVGDQVIINEVVLPHVRKTGDHLHVLIKEVHFMGDKVLLLFDMSGDF